MSWEPSVNYKAATFLPHYARREASEIVAALSCTGDDIADADYLSMFILIFFGLKLL